MLVFDALIGNNDRHDENWGLIFDRDLSKFKFSPIYDNASCLTSGLNENSVDEFLNNPVKLEKYIRDSKSPNLYLNLTDEKHYKHFEIMEFLLTRYDIVESIILDILKYDILSYTNKVIEKIQKLDVPDSYKLSNNRKNLILKILELRINKLKDLVNVHN